MKIVFVLLSLWAPLKFHAREEGFLCLAQPQLCEELENGMDFMKEEFLSVSYLFSTLF